MENHKKYNDKNADDDALITQLLHSQRGTAASLSELQKNNKGKNSMQLNSPRLKYQSSDNLDLDIALQVKRADISRLLEEVTLMEAEINKLQDQLIKLIHDEKWLLEMHAKRLLRDHLIED